MALLYIAAIAATLLFTVHVVRCLKFGLSYPSAAGSFWARWTKAWYIRKIWQGKFETWNIEAHQGGAQKIVRVAPNMYSIDDPDAAVAIHGIASRLPKTKWYDAWGDPRVPNHTLFSARDRTVHATIRRKIASMYSLSSVKSYEPYVDNCVKLVIDNFDKFAVSGEAIDLGRWMQCYAFDVIGEITFGGRVGFLESGAQDLEGIMQGLENGAIFSTLSGLEMSLAPALFAMYGNPAKGVVSFAKNLFAKAKKDEANNQDGRESFIQKVDRIKKESPEEYERLRLADSVLISNIVAGSDTTNVALTSVLYYLSTTAGVAERLLHEISQVAPDLESDQILTFEQTLELPYFKNVVKEALRMHASIGLPLWREVVEEPLTVAGTTFPIGTHVGVNPWVAHRNTEVYGADVTSFVPDRWDPSITPVDKLALMEKYYMPYGAGARGCIGRHIAQLEMSKLIPQLVRRYRFEMLAPELEYTNRWFVKPENVLVRLKRRI